MGLVGDGWVWLEMARFFWGWVAAVEIGVTVEISVGLGFVFIGLVVGGVFLGFCRGRCSVMEVEIGVAVFVFQRWRCLGEFGFVFMVFFLDVDLYVYFLDLLGLIY